MLKITDFGLARRLFVDRDTHVPIQEYDYTNRVVTLWYRSPELLLGSTKYSFEVDMWSAGYAGLPFAFSERILPHSNIAFVGALWLSSFQGWPSFKLEQR